MNKALAGINKNVSPPVFWGANLAIFILIIINLLLGEAFVEGIDEVKNLFLQSAAWLYILPIIFLFIFLIKILYLYGDLKVGGELAEKEFSNLAWISMLFSAGLGIGLLYSGTYEPMAYYFGAPQLEGLESGQKFIASLHISYFHWGAPAWTIYSATGLMMGFSGFGRSKNFLFSTYAPFKNPIGHHIINIITILSILLGVVTAFAIGVQQINVGIHKLFPGVPIGVEAQAVMILIITVVATISVLSGLQKGIKYLSLFNVVLACLVFLYIFSHVSLSKYFGVFIEAGGYHISHFVEALTYTASYKDKAWLGNWTILYWAWWASWAPFVGLFIARISKGRTIKEFFVGTVLAPSLVCALWITAFGILGFDLHSKGTLNLQDLINNAPGTILFSILDTMNLSLLFSTLALICVIIFYVTSSDSGSYVVDMIASGGKLKPHPYLKIYWSLVEGVLAFVLILTGGIIFIKNLVVLTSLPILLYICYGTYKLSHNLKHQLK